MKKKLLFTALIAVMLVCAFAFSVNAETISYGGETIELVNDLGDPSWHTGNAAIAIQDKESIVILKDANGVKTAYPSYYVFRVLATVKDGVVTDAYINYVSNNGIDYSFINDNTDKEYDYGSMYYVEIPYGITRCANNDVFGRDKDISGQYEPNIVEIVIPDSVTKIETQAFRRMVSCTKVTMSKNIVSISDWAFCGSEKLSTIVFPENSALQTIGNSFSGCKAIKSFDFSKVPNLVTMGGTFSGADLTGPVDLSMLGNLKEINGTFNGCSKITMVTLPDTLEVIGDNAFSNCTNMYFASDYLPSSLKRIGAENGGGGHFLKYCTNVNSTLYFPASLTEISSQYNFEGTKTASGNPLNLVFLGKMTVVSLAGGRMSDWSSVKITFYFAQNTASELNGKIVTAYKDESGQMYYVACDANKDALYTLKENQGLTLTLSNNDPNNESLYGTDANGNRLNKISASSPSFVFCGGETVEEVFWARNGSTNSGYQAYFTTPYVFDMNAHTTANKHYNSIVYQEGNCGYDECTTTTCIVCDLVNKVYTDVKATGEHTFEDDFNCATAVECDVCKMILAEAASHALSTQLSGGIVTVGERNTECTNDGCNFCETVALSPMFTFLGYSAKELNDDEAGIMFGYKIDKDAIAEYEAYAEKIEFGTLAVFQSKLGNNAPIVNGEAAQISNCNLIMPKLRDAVIEKNVTRVDFVLRGSMAQWDTVNESLGNVKINDAPIILAGYVIDSNNNVTYFNTVESAECQGFAYSYNGLSK